MTWLKSNRWVLIALVVLAAASAWYSFAFDWTRYQDGNPTRILDVPEGKQATYGGGIFSLDDLTVLPGDSPEGEQYGVADGTDLVVVDLNVTPREGGDPEDFVQCEVRLLAPSPDGEREWWPESFNPTTFPDGDPDVFSCNIAGGPAYVYREFFVVPAGGAADAVVQVTLMEELPLALRLH
jgi:hypothetical protein